MSSCDLFLFGFVKNELIDKHYGMPDDVFRDVKTIILKISDELLSRVFRNWQEQLQQYSVIQ
jgi:hypothetical protein